MKTGQKYFTPACMSEMLNITFDGLHELIEKLKIAPAFHLNNTPYYSEAGVKRIGDAAFAADKAAAASGKWLRAAAEPELMLTGGTVELQAAASADASPKLTMLAYAGGVMNVGAYGAVVVDLAGLQFTGTLPLLAEHDASFTGTIGSVVPSVGQGKLTATGSLVRSSETAGKIIELSRAGVPIQASIGAEPLESRLVKQGESVSVNGQTLVGPFRLVSKSRLREISIVSIGADSNTSVKIAAQRQGNQTMSKFNDSNVITGAAGEVDGEVKAERDRVAAISRLAAKYGNDKLVAKAIEEGWSANDAELHLLRASRTSVPGVIRGNGGNVEMPKLMAAALTSKLCGAQFAEKQYGETVMEQSHRMHRMHLLDMCRIACEADGIMAPSGSVELVRAALSTTSLPTALGDSAEKRLLSAYNEAPSSWRAFASIQPAANFKGQKSLRPTWGGQVHQVAPGGELKHNTVTEGLVVDWQIDTFGEILAIDRRDIINDDLSVFDQAADALGRKALRGVSDLVWQIILANGGSFFSSGNSNLLTSGTSALSLSSLQSAVAAFLVQRDADGNDLDIRPEALVVPPELRTVAQQILSSMEIRVDTSTTNDRPTGNPLQNALKLEIESRISNVVKWASTASLTQWYVFGGPSTAPVIVGFLDGRQTPVVEGLGMSATPNLLAYQWRVYHDYGAALGDPKAAVKSAGA